MKKIFSLLLLTSVIAYAANEYKQPNAAIFYKTITLPALGTSGIVTNTSGGLLGTTTTLPIANGGTNTSNALNNNRVIVSSGGTVGESSTTTTQLGFLDATSSIQTQLNGKQSTITTLPISLGGTNSSKALNNARLIVSSGGTIGEFSTGSPNQILQSNGGSAPTWTTNISGNAVNVTGIVAIANGGTNSGNALNNNRFMVSSGGTIGEGAQVLSNSIVGTDVNGLPTTLAIPLPVADGGTNYSKALVNGRLIVSSGGTIGEFSTGTPGQVLQSNGGSAPTWVTNSPVFSGLTTNGVVVATSSSAVTTTAAGSLGFPLISQSTTAPQFAQLGLTTGVTGILPIANGGRNSGAAITGGRVIVSSAGTIGELTSGGTVGTVLTSQGPNGQLPTWTSTLTNPMTTTGDMIYSSSGSTPARLAIASGGSVLTGGTIPGWKSMMLNGSVLEVGLTATVVPAGGSGNPIKFDTIIKDTASAYSASTGLFTCPVTGSYLISFEFYTSTSGGQNYQLYRSGTSLMYIARSVAAAGSASAIVECTVGQTLSIAPDASTSLDGNVPFLNYLSIMQIH